METRLIVAYALIGLMVTVGLVLVTKLSARRREKRRTQKGWRRKD